MVELKNLNFGYSADKKVFENLSYRFSSGKIHIIAGKSGSGKTTLLDLIFGFLKPAAGSIYVGNKPVTGVLSGWAAYLVADPERYFFEPHVIDEVAFTLRFAGLKKEDARKKAAGVLSELGIDENFYWRNPLQLSKGQKRKVAVASALVLEKELLLLDEPLAGLDRSGRMMVADLLKKAVNAGCTVILTAHTFDELLELGPEVHLIFNRKLVLANLDLPDKSLVLFQEAGLLPPEKLLVAAELCKRGFHISVFQSDAEFVRKATEMMTER